MKKYLLGIKIILGCIFSFRKKYKLQFNCEEDNKWYINFPNWPFDHHNLMMVAGADKLCEFLSSDGKFTYVEVIPSNKEKNYNRYAKLIRKEHSLTGGSVYKVVGLKEFNRDIWLCPVTLFVLGNYPKYIYIRKDDSITKRTSSRSDR